MLLRGFAIALLLVVRLGAAEAETGGDLVIAGAKQVAEGAVRAAIANDLTLWLSRHPAASREAWPTALAERVRAGYRAAGYRDAQAAASQDGQRTALTIVEGRRWVCGELRLVGFGEQEPLVRRALTTPSESPQLVDMDTVPDHGSALWRPGEPVDWRPSEGDRLADLAGETLRESGVSGAMVATRWLPRDDGVADAELTCAIPCTPIRLGSVRITGLDAADGDRLRQWLGLPTEAAATATLSFAVARRLRDCGRYISAQVSWEDNPPAFALEDLHLTPVEVADRRRLARQVAIEAVARKGRADLLIAVLPRPGFAPPWQAPVRELACALAAHARTLQRLNEGTADAVVEMRCGDRSERVVWSPSHGVALVRGNGAVLALDHAGLAVVPSAGRPLRFRFPHVFLLINVASDAQYPDKWSFNGQVGATSHHIPMRVRLDMPPEAMASAALRVLPWQTAQDAWRGEALERTVRTATEAWVISLDPATGIAWRTIGGPIPTATASGIRWSMSLKDDAWRRDVEPLIAGAAPPATRPAGALLLATAEALQGIVDHPSIERIWRQVGDLARSGAADAIFDRMPSFGDDDGFSIPNDDGSDFRVPIMVLIPVRACAWIETRLADRLPASAWPRILLRGTACALLNQRPLVMADLRQAAGDQTVGPLGLLALAHGVKLLGLAPLARDMAEQGLGRCNADGFAAEARNLAGLAPELLPVAADLAEGAASLMTDAARRTALLGLAACCRNPGDPATRWEQAARLAADLGAGAWLSERLREFLAGGAPTY